MIFRLRTLSLFVCLFGGLPLTTSATETQTGLFQIAIDEVFRLDAPAMDGSESLNLSTTPKGDAILSWLAPVDASKHALRYARWQNGKWSTPLEVATSDRWFVNWADIPSVISLGEGRLAAHWLETNASAPYAYDVRISLSHDSGRSWASPFTPHRDGTKTQHGFVSMMPTEDSNLGILWLDGRENKDDPFSGNMALRYAEYSRNNGLKNEALLDERTCSCCQTAMTVIPGGAAIAYRDRTENEIRDISIIRLQNGKWSAPTSLHNDGWKIDGCPVNGPAIDSNGEKIAVAWFTDANDTPRVNLAFSDDAGKTFSAPIRVDRGDPIGRVDVVQLPNQSALVGWLEATDSGDDYLLREIKPNDSVSSPITIVSSKDGQIVDTPKMTRANSGIMVAWNFAEGPTTSGATKIKAVFIRLATTDDAKIRKVER